MKPGWHEQMAWSSRSLQMEFGPQGFDAHGRCDTIVTKVSFKFCPQSTIKYAVLSTIDYLGVERVDTE